LTVLIIVFCTYFVFSDGLERAAKKQENQEKEKKKKKKKKIVFLNAVFLFCGREMKQKRDAAKPLSEAEAAEAVEKRKILGPPEIRFGAVCCCFCFVCVCFFLLTFASHSG
jgi:hypothetical protein